MIIWFVHVVLDFPQLVFKYLYSLHHGTKNLLLWKIRQAKVLVFKIFFFFLDKGIFKGLYNQVDKIKMVVDRPTEKCGGELKQETNRTDPNTAQQIESPRSTPTVSNSKVESATKANMMRNFAANEFKSCVF